MPAPIRPASLRGSAAIAAAVVAVGLVPLAGTTASAAPPGGEPVTIASGLDNPRQLSIGPGNRLYVAEAGSTAACDAIPGVDPAFAWCGLTGAVTEVRDGQQRRVVTGVPTLSFGGDAIGASDVVVRGRTISLLIGGMSGAASARDDLGGDYGLFGTLRSGRLGGAPLDAADLGLAADLNAFEVAENPDGSEAPDSNAVGMAPTGAGWAVADAGGNTVVGVDRGGLEALAVLPAGAPVPNPFGPGLIPPEAVPTDVAVGPDGALYVSQLTGFPFPEGGSSIWRIGTDGQVSTYATGLTTVTSLAWRDGALYAVQLDDADFFDGAVGSLRRVTPGGSDHAVVVDGLEAPYGLAIRGHSAFVTVGSTSTGGGSVLQIDLR